MDIKNYDKKDNENKNDVNIKNIDNPLCKDGVCKIPENNFEKEKLVHKNIMLDINKQTDK